MRILFTFIRNWIGLALLVIALVVLVPLGQHISLASPLAAEPLVQVTPLPAGQMPVGPSLLVGETEAAGRTSFWLTQPANPVERLRLGVFIHQAGYPPSALISPDGQHLAISLIPPGTPERLVRTAGSQIWVMDTTGANLRQVAYDVASLAAWSPDGQSLVVQRLVARESSDDLRSPEGQIPYRTEYDLVDVQSGTTTQLTADETSYGTQPLGWPAGSAGFRFARISLDGRWDIAEVAPGEIAPKSILQIPPEYGVRGISLSPDGGYALVDAIKAENSVLSAFDLKTGNEQVFGETPSTGQAYAPFSGLFRPDGQVLLVNQRSTVDKPGKLQAVSMRNQVGVQTALAYPSTPQDDQLLPVRWSADGQWLVWLGIPDIGSQVYVQRVGGALVPLPRSDPDNSMRVYGFTTSYPSVQ
jgi:dipeptidyl aminopeptidase/acylaminoacyl peptidase